MSAPFPTIAGLDLPKQYLAACATGEGHHALLLHGPQGVGKLALAVAYAKTVMGPAESGPSLFGEAAPDGLSYDPTHPDVHLIDRGSHPDVIVFSRSRELLAEEAREVIERLMTSPQRGPRKIVILDNAEQFNPSVANLLLKTLEEPPPWGQFLLLTNSAEQLLPTIRSRTLPVPCRESALGDVVAQVSRYFPAGLHDDLAAMAPWVGGRVGDLLRFVLLPGYRAFREKLLAFLQQVLSTGNDQLFDLEKQFADLFSGWEKLAEEESLPLGADLADLSAWQRDQDGIPQLVNFHGEEDAPPAAARQRIFLAMCGRLALAAYHQDPAWRTERGRNLLEALRRAPRRVDYNANWSLVLEALLLESLGYDCGLVQV